ncbi:hypothetical protein [Sphingosinicella sp. BN140058]|uniref:hypothetical protein n=1 Tax=Sphingosinicella sp. BN140058 TaxID=1892855 RepID=UPI00101081A6|nr:hypothetical protein [Sphingosinicella sp. BN140058]QAY79396.1 hypothetical protein ETR14_24785 [Sphingosinicella sp. BN140058]
MVPLSFGLQDPRRVGIGSALASTCLGLCYLAAAGAPARYLVVNAAAFLLGLFALRAVGGAVSHNRRFASATMLLCGHSLLATSLFGAAVEGATRWIWVGPLSVQVSLVLVPFMILAFVRRPDALGAGAIAFAALALALQPDRAMAGVLAVGLVVLAVMRPGLWSVAALCAAVCAFAASIVRADALPAVPYVDQILFSAFDVHVMAGAAVVLGSFLLLVPAIVGGYRDPEQRVVYLSFGAIWIGCVLAAALGNYPTPVVGYGGSAILGYLLGLAALPSAGSVPVQARRPSPPNDAGETLLPRSALAA